MIRNFYNLPIDDLFYAVPEEAWGVPDVHPIMIVLLGTQSNTMRLIKYHNDVF